MSKHPVMAAVLLIAFAESANAASVTIDTPAAGTTFAVGVHFDSNGRSSTTGTFSYV